ncbi:S8 family serine peptidase [Melissospora conviva]|uniref:S8 family serine peptidase n=1 Tax=Melissospora conviva TaxID=3388432 RepID=UPI003B7C838E
MQKSGKRWGTIGSALVLLLGVAAPGVAAPGTDTPAGEPGRVAAAAPGQAPVRVTLITGDQVTAAGNKLTVRPGAGREGMTFQSRRVGGHVHVVPRDAEALIRAGRLDARLFDVTTLAEYGYGDAERDDLPLLLTYANGISARSAADGVTITRQLPAIDGAAGVVDKDEATEVWNQITGQAGARAAAGVPERIWLDGRRKVSLGRSVAQIGAPAAYEAGLTGAGVTVAVLDTGVDATHPDLAGRVAEARNFSETPEATDTVGHGTHVASIIAGSGAASDGRYRGVAPDATLVSGKVCESDWCTDSAILAGMHWAAVEQRAAVINISLGGTDTPEIDPLEEAVNTLTAETGSLFVVSAGNDGDFAPVGSPASADAALAVGAVDSDDQLAYFSSRGPRTGDDGLKPDVTAPGVGIVAARAVEGVIGDPVGEGYVALSGTSMAAPHVAAAAALLAQQHPEWAAGQLKSVLMGSAAPNPELTAYEQGAGRIDVARAIDQTVTSEPTGISFGRTLWPHDDDEPITRELTYHNSGDTDLVLSLTAEVSGPGGAAAPDGLFRFGTDRLTVPAGGKAEVAVTVDTRVGGPDGRWSGRVVARAGDVAVQTPVAVNKEVESYELTLDFVDLDLGGEAGHRATLLSLDEFRLPIDETGQTARLRLPKGRYGVHTTFWAVDADAVRDEAAVLAAPELILDRDVRLTIDANRSAPVRLTVPDRDATGVLATIDGNYFGADAAYSFGMFSDNYDGFRSGQIGAAVAAERFVASFAAQWAEAEAASSPYLYAVAAAVPGRMPTGFVRDYRRRDLAVVVQEFAASGGGLLAERSVFADVGYNTGGWASVLPTATPGRRVEYVNTDGVRWDSSIAFGTPVQDLPWLDVQAELQEYGARYRGGRQYRDRWNAAPLSQSFAEVPWGAAGLFRTGDVINLLVPLHSDAAGHAGGSLTDTARTALYRDGVLVGESTEPGYGAFEVPAAAGRYLLETSATRSFTDLSTEVGTAWTFRSGPVRGDEPVMLPAMAVRFAPKLDLHNSAPAGRAFELPVRVEQQPGAPRAKVRTVTVEVSYDGGRSWTRAKVRQQAKGWTAQLHHPRGAQYVSLRATATDSAGNSVTQRVIQAYRLR